MKTAAQNERQPAGRDESRPSDMQQIEDYKLLMEFTSLGLQVVKKQGEKL